MNPTNTPIIDRNTAIKTIREALKRRSGKVWSVTGGRGTAWGWLTITAPPARCNFDWHGLPSGDSTGYPSASDRHELAKLLGIEAVHPQGVRVPEGSDHYQEWMDRAEGRTPRVIGKRDWD